MAAGLGKSGGRNGTPAAMQVKLFSYSWAGVPEPANRSGLSPEW